MANSMACLQAAVDAESAQKAQEAWLKENLQPHFARKLLRMVGKIAKFVLAGDGNSEHAFPRLAGSHLSAVSTDKAAHQISILTPCKSFPSDEQSSDELFCIGKARQPQIPSGIALTCVRLDTWGMIIVLCCC